MDELIRDKLTWGWVDCKPNGMMSVLTRHCNVAVLENEVLRNCVDGI